MPNKLLFCLTALVISGCVVVPETAPVSQYQCGLSTDKKTLKVVNLMDGDTTFYAWSDEMLSALTMPTTAIINGVYVAVNNVYHYGEKIIKCGN